MVDAIYEYTLLYAIKELRTCNGNIPKVHIIDNSNIKSTSFRINKGDIHEVQFCEKIDRVIIIQKIIEIMKKELKVSA